MPIPPEVEEAASMMARKLMQPLGDTMPKEPLEIIAGTPDQPLVIGDVEIQCYVLSDETRVLSRGGFQGALGRHRTSRKHLSDDVVNLPAFLAASNLKPFISKDLVTASTPVAFRAPSRGPVAYGFRAELLPGVCEVYLKARDAKALLPSQEHIAERASILIRGLATVGIIALVDEATGYQQIRAERALATILEKYIAKELQPWTKTFPYEFYKQIFRLRGWEGPEGAKRPGVIGLWTNDFVYQRLAPGLLEELQRRNPTLPSGNRSHRHTQWFTPEFGHPKLKEHLAGVIAVMRVSSNWNAFKRNLDLAFPSFRETMQFPLDDPTS